MLMSRVFCSCILAPMLRFMVKVRKKGGVPSPHSSFYSTPASWVERSTEARLFGTPLQTRNQRWTFQKPLQRDLVVVSLGPMP